MELIAPSLQQPPRRLPHYQRASSPPPMALTPRDRHILETIHQFEGMLADYQIERLFFASTPRMKARMSLLYHNNYVDRFTRQQQSNYGFMAYFVAEQGIEYLSNKHGLKSKELRPRTKEERNSLIQHDVTLNDVRIAILEALARQPQAQLLEWVTARTFARDYDTITYTDQQGMKKKRNMHPDAYCHIRTGRQHSHLFLEVDRSSESNRRFVDEKVRPSIFYLASEQYKQRFGTDRGRWLVIVRGEDDATGERRVEYMKHQAEKAGEAVRIFFYTTFKEATRPGAFFTEPIWRRPTFDKPVALWSEKASAKS